MMLASSHQLAGWSRNVQQIIQLDCLRCLFQKRVLETRQAKFQIDDSTRCSSTPIARLTVNWWKTTSRKMPSTDKLWPIERGISLNCAVSLFRLILKSLIRREKTSQLLMRCQSKVSKSSYRFGKRPKLNPSLTLKYSSHHWKSSLVVWMMLNVTGQTHRYGNSLLTTMWNSWWNEVK